MTACARPDCGATYSDDAGGRHNHKVLHGHTPTPAQPRRRTSLDDGLTPEQRYLRAIFGDADLPAEETP